jgi:hypothetical protein
MILELRILNELRPRFLELRILKDLGDYFAARVGGCYRVTRQRVS